MFKSRDSLEVVEYKTRNAEEKRKFQSKKALERFPNKVPVILLKHKTAKCTELLKQKYHYKCIPDLTQLLDLFSIET